MEKKIIATSQAPSAIGPYSQAVKAHNFLFISGQIPLHPETGDIVEGIEAGTHQVMKNLQAILNSENLSFENVVKTTIFLASMDDFLTVNEIYAGYFLNTNYPARETVAVKTLPKNVLVEISMIAME